MTDTTDTIKIEGMHCASCALNIDFELEDVDGVKEACTHYAKQETTVTYDPQKVSRQKVVDTINSLGYTTQ